MRDIIGKITAAMSLLCLSLVAWGVSPQADSVSHERIDSSTISVSSFYGNSISSSGSPLMKISGMPLPQNATVEQILRLMPSVDIRERGGKSVQTDIGVRGGSPDQTAILLNGVDFTDIRTGHQTHSLPVDADAITGARLLDGGDKGLTGALNIVASPLYENYLRLNLSAGAYGYRYLNLSGAASVQGKGVLDVFEAASLRQSDGYRPCTDFRNTNLYSRFRYREKSIGTIDAQIGYQNRAFGANGFYSLKYPEQFEETSTSLASIRWSGEYEHLQMESYVSYRHNTDRFELIRGSEKAVPFNYHITDNFGGVLTAAYLWAAGSTSLGGELRRSGIKSTVLGTELAEPVTVTGRSDRFYTKGGSRTWGNIHIQHRKQWNHVELSAAVEGMFSPFGFTPLWNAGLGLNPSGNWTFSLIGARTTRLPTFTDLYYTAEGYEGNADLVPEKAMLAIAGAEYAKGNWNFQADMFFRHGSNIIDWVKEDGMSNWKSLQVTQMNTIGADMSLSFAPEGRFLERVSVKSGYVGSDKSAGGMISKYAMDYMRLKASVMLSLKFGKHVRLSADASYCDRAGNYVDKEGRTVPYRPYCLMNTTVSYISGALRYYVDIDNVTATSYYDFGGLEMPGIWAMGGVVVTLK